MDSRTPIPICLAPGLPDAVVTAVGAAPGLAASAEASAEVVIASADGRPPAPRSDGPAVVAIGDPRTASTRWLEREPDVWSSPATFARTPERIVARALAARRAQRIGPGDDEAGWLDAVRTITAADGVARVWPDHVVSAGDDAAIARDLAAVMTTALSGMVVVSSEADFRERFALEVPVDGLVAVPLGGRLAEGVLILWVRAGGSDWVREALPCVRAVAATAQRDALRRRLDSADLGRRWAEKLLHRMLSVVSHDLRNPLFAVQLGVKVLEREVGRTDPIATIQRALGTGTQMLRKLVDAGRVVLEPPAPAPPGAVADLPQVLDRAVATIAHNRPEARLLTTRWTGSIPVSADPATLERLLALVLDNAALHATDPTVHVSVDCDGETARIAIRNAGRLPFVDSDRVEPFEHRANGGLGVGLYHARRLATAHAATLKVRQDGDHVDTLVVLRLEDP